MDLNERKGIRARGTDSARVIQVIKTCSMRGAGTYEDPVREVTQYWTLEGELIGDDDSFDYSDGGDTQC